MSKQTALKWFVEQLGLDATNDYKAEIAIALQMEREQIEDAWIAVENPLHRKYARKYYNETYGGNNE